MQQRQEVEALPDTTFDSPQPKRARREITMMILAFTAQRPQALLPEQKPGQTKCQKQQLKLLKWRQRCTGMSAREAQDRFLNEAGVATVAGTSFGAWGEGYLRFSYANSVENIREALRRISGLL